MLHLDDLDIILSPIQEQLLELLYIHKEMERADIIATVNRPETTVNDNLATLVRLRLIRKVSRLTNVRGRPKKIYRLNIIFL